MNNNNNVAVVNDERSHWSTRPLSIGNLFCSVRVLPESDSTVEGLQTLRPLVGFGVVMCLLYVAALI